MFFKNHAANKAGRLAAALFLCFKKVLREVKANSLHLGFSIYIDISRLEYCNKNKLYKTLDGWPRNMLNLIF